MNDPVEMRQHLRTVLSAMPRERRACEEWILAKLNGILPDRVTVDEMRRAIEWNQIKGYVDYARNADLERDEWYLTERGWQKEGL